MSIFGAGSSANVLPVGSEEAEEITADENGEITVDFVTGKSLGEQYRFFETVDDGGVMPQGIELKGNSAVISEDGVAGLVRIVDLDTSGCVINEDYYETMQDPMQPIFVKKDDTEISYSAISIEDYVTDNAQDCDYKGKNIYIETQEPDDDDGCIWINVGLGKIGEPRLIGTIEIRKYESFEGVTTLPEKYVPLVEAYEIYATGEKLEIKSLETLGE